MTYSNNIDDAAMQKRFTAWQTAKKQKRHSNHAEEISAAAEKDQEKFIRLANWLKLKEDEERSLAMKAEEAGRGRATAENNEDEDDIIELLEMNTDEIFFFAWMR